MNDSALTLIIVVFTAIIAFVVAKVAPTLQNEEKKCPPCQQPTAWRFLGGSIWIRRRQEIEENYHGVLPPEGK